MRHAGWGVAVLLLTGAVRADEKPVAGGAAPLPMYVVTVPVADLRAEPKHVDGAAALRAPYAQDPLEETQLLYGERVKILLENGPWARVEAVDQEEYTHADAWTGYPGWVPKAVLAPEPADYRPNAVVSGRYADLKREPSRRTAGVAVPAGARLMVTFQKDAWVRIHRPEGGDGWLLRKDVRLASEFPSTDAGRRESILETARMYLAEPYYWGGRAGHRPEDVDAPSGMDCSGLVNVAYRVAGVEVPRDSHEQFMRAQRLSSAADLKAGDLIFLSWTKNPDKVTHVMIYAGGDTVVEAVQEQNNVRQVTVKEKLGAALADIDPMTPVGDRFVSFGRLLPE